MVFERFCTSHFRFGFVQEAVARLNSLCFCSEKGYYKFIYCILVITLLTLGVKEGSVVHVHIAIFWTIVLGIIGSIIGGGVSHMFSRPTNERYHPAGLIFPHWARCWFFSFAIS